MSLPPSAELEAALLREQPALLTYAFRLLGRDADAHDCVQDAVLKAWEAVRAGSLPLEWRPWLFRLTHHAAVDRLRRRVVEARARQEVRSSTSLSEVTPAGLEELLSGLPMESRALLLLRFAYGLTFAEIADILGRPAPTLQVYAGRALALLHETLSKESSHELR